jgi:hypothetical protein
LRDHHGDDGEQQHERGNAAPPSDVAPASRSASRCVGALARAERPVAGGHRCVEL